LGEDRIPFLGPAQPIRANEIVQEGWKKYAVSIHNVHTSKFRLHLKNTEPNSKDIPMENTCRYGMFYLRCNDNMSLVVVGPKDIDEYFWGHQLVGIFVHDFKDLVHGRRGKSHFQANVEQGIQFLFVLFP